MKKILLLLTVAPLLLSSCNNDEAELNEEEQKVTPVDESIAIPEVLTITKTDAGYRPVVTPISQQALLSCLGKGGWSYNNKEYRVFEDGRLSDVLTMMAPIARSFFISEDNTLGVISSGIGPNGETVAHVDYYPFEYDEETNTLSYGNDEFRQSLTILYLTSSELHCTKPLSEADSYMIDTGYDEPYVLHYYILEKNDE